MESTKAYTQYTDYHGTVAADIRDQYGSLGQWANKHGVDTDRYFILGITWYVSEASPNNRHELNMSVSVLGIDKNVAGSNYEVILEHIKSTGYRPKLTKFNIEVGTADYLDAFKRFNVSLWKDGLEQMAAYDEEESVEVPSPFAP